MRADRFDAPEAESPATGTKQFFHGYCWWEDGTSSHGTATLSPNCKTQNELREWVKAKRFEHVEREGFTFRAFRREYLVDNRGQALAGTSTDHDLTAQSPDAKEDYRTVWLEQTLRTLRHEIPDEGTT